MEGNSVERIEQLAVTAAQLDYGTDMPLAVLGKDFQIHNLEKYQLHRIRQRGNYSTEVLGEFIQYVIGRKLPDATGFIGTARLSATCIFNIGNAEDPGHCDDTAVLSPKALPLYAALLAAHNKAMSQKELSEWIEDWRDFLTVHATNDDDPLANGDEIHLSRAITSVRTLTIQQVNERTTAIGDLKASRSSLEQIEAKSTGAIPSRIYASAIPYEGFSERSVGLRISIMTGDDKPKFFLRIMQLEALQESLANEFKSHLCSGLGEDFKLYVGSFDPLE